MTQTRKENVALQPLIELWTLISDVPFEIVNI